MKAGSRTDTPLGSRVKPLAILATVDLRHKPQAPAPAPDTGSDDVPQSAQVSFVTL